MRELPQEVVHLPFSPGSFRMAMDLVSVAEADWFELDRRYLGEMAERRRLLDSAHGEVFAALPVSDAARREALEVVVAALTLHHPDWFSCDGGVARNHLTGECWDMTAKGGAVTAGPAWPPRTMTTGGRHPVPGTGMDPLELAGRLVQEDLCLVQNGSDGPVFTAAMLCFPSRWRLMDKIGKRLADVHGPVPLYADRLAAPVDRFMRHLKVGHIASRLNWSLLDDPALFQPGGKWRVKGDAGITGTNAGERVFLRVERQTLRRLPASGAVLFGIRVHVYRLDRVIDGAERAAALAEAVRALPAEVQHYKSLLPFRAAVLGWLGEFQAGGGV